VGQKEGPLIPIEIESSSKYKSERETSIGSALPLYMFSPPTPPLPSSYTMSQHDLHAIIRQQQEQLLAIQA